MNVELGILNDGRVAMVGDGLFPGVVSHVEYYRDQSLLQLVFDDDNLDDELMECEVPAHLTGSIEKNPNVIILSVLQGYDPLGYKAPLIKVGELY